ncbi:MULTISPECIES: arginine decarboxylase [unclassified Neisseria]|uniref:arginine decarboxylase n=1 Tax=unclassified Neisseria TaxID=2623750 RepID=UPI002666E79C|nr:MULTISPECIES: arginine decarboxylase [unclassified Neisseria]MDO1509921.1 arginine decarboxylase [Neisseria sp. MVDL19-042950]MDO1516120.1 arginine decarboxylase [Neisseria sp. MVDL18-041461]MDO1563235.1 arginine decarboxylase [Neisseria sp. MVDL20-010259]
MSWSVADSASLYGIRHWGDRYYSVNGKGRVVVRPNDNSDVQVDLYDLVGQLNERGQDLPMLFRFPDILQDRVARLCAAFNRSIRKNEYQGRYTAIYPIKVNQQESVVKNIIVPKNDQVSIGLEAGSKPELMIVLAFAPKGGTIVCNGYKDRDFIRLALMGQRLGHQVFIVIEKETEVDLVIEESQKLGVKANLGLRVRLSSLASGKWADTGGEKGKFGLSAAQLISSAEKLTAAGLADTVKLMHFHMGSQISNIADYRAGFKEAVRYFAELRGLGLPIEYVDVGGGLGVDYDGTHSRNASSINYDMGEYSHVIVSMLAEYCNENGVPHPNIFSESGRAMTAHHAVLVMNVTDVERLPEEVPEITDEENLSFATKKLIAYLDINDSEMVTETYYRIGHYLTEVTGQYLEGKVPLKEKALAEQLHAVLCRRLKQQLQASRRSQRQVYDDLNDKLADKYFCNFSVFQSLPDTWAIGQVLPIMPLHRLDEYPTRRAVLQDLTCDSDGKISQYVDQQSIESSMRVHEPKPKEPYLLGVFMVGAYQEILGDMHNLFGDTDSVNVYVRDNGEIVFGGMEEHDTIEDMLHYVHLSPEEVLNKFEEKSRWAKLGSNERNSYFAEFCRGLKQSSYLSIEVEEN